MLTNLVEKKRTKCSQYWPDQSQPTLHLGNMTIKHQNTEVYSTYVIRFFSIEVDYDIRNVVQFHYTAWPGYDVPKLEELPDFCRVVLNHTNKYNVPVVVHCSAGVGRTGTWIALMRLIRQVIVAGKKVNIDDVIQHSCSQRARGREVNPDSRCFPIAFRARGIDQGIDADQTTLMIDQGAA